MMNDFTKDEMELLKDSVWCYEDLREPKDPTRKFLIDKILSLIDNYCEHERDEKEAPKLSHFTAEEGCVFIVKCKRCGKFYR